MKTKIKAIASSVKAVFFSIGDALAFRKVTRDPNNRDITYEPLGGNTATPHIDRALQLSTVWSCVRLISGAISTLPIFLYERIPEEDREDGRKLARKHPLYALLHDSPNYDMTAVEFWECIAVGMLTWGNAYVLITRGYGGKIVSLDPLNPALVTIRRTLDGAVTYIYADERGKKEYSEGEVWHIKGFGSTGLVGLSPIGFGWRSMVGAVNVENAASSMFGGNMRPSGVVSIKDILKPDQRAQLQEVITKGVFGSAEMGRLQLLEGGMEYKQLTINPLDAQMLETRQYSVEEMCRWFQVPPSMIGHGTAVSNWGTGRQEINLGFKQYVLEQYTKKIQQSISKHLLSPVERTKYYAEFSFEGLLRADSEGRANFYDKMIKAGIYTPNFCRSLENLEPLPGGDQLFMQSAMLPLEKLGQVTPGNDSATIGQDTDEEESHELPD